VPRLVACLIGVAIVLALLAPFWLSALTERSGSKPHLVPLEDSAEPSPPAGLDGAARLSPAATPPGALRPCNQFLDVRLDMSREELAQRYTLQLRNTRGMVPEIYEAAEQHAIKFLAAHFYQNQLKEFHLVLPERQTIPPTLVTELRAQFGDPLEWSDADLPVAAAGFEQPQGVWSRLLADFRWQRQLLWADADNLLEATVYSTSTDPQLCVSMVAVHATAVRWLEENRSPLPVSTPGPAVPPIERPRQVPEIILEPETNPPIVLPKFGLGR